MQQLGELGTEAVRKQNRKQGAGDNQFGVRLGEIRKVAKALKKNPDAARALWATGIIDARQTAILVLQPKHLSAADLDRMVREITFSRVADWFNDYLAKKHPDREALRLAWLEDPDPMARRAGWSLTHDRIVKTPEGLDPGALLERIEAEAGAAPEAAQWTMNFCLVAIGIRDPELRPRAIAVGEALGLYRDYPTRKGCTSPFAPIWIEEMVSRQDQALAASREGSS